MEALQRENGLWRHQALVLFYSNFTSTLTTIFTPFSTSN